MKKKKYTKTMTFRVEDKTFINEAEEAVSELLNQDVSDFLRGQLEKKIKEFKAKKKKEEE